ncbi:hypothetical protein G6L99_30375 [Agrobacterium rhizogenes]|uniref:replication initiation protein RepC n=1 Tax=Rhizobium rhizogenes TaxID=359 RepID=UPI0015733860|nr:replication initiation protein RepC [Rhizobium rhizogenes]NTH16438.1 hypothetical protein [Rhizobium rhizogenes]NTI78235.1 hypothetical protein [Rhizobium rhizogenes]
MSNVRNILVSDGTRFSKAHLRNVLFGGESATTCLDNFPTELKRNLKQLQRFDTFRVIAQGIVIDEMELLLRKLVEQLETEAETTDINADKPVKQGRTAALLEPFPLNRVLQVCPRIVDCAPNGAIGDWGDLILAAAIARPRLGISLLAYQDACFVMGLENAATVVACLLERGAHTNQSDGSERDRTQPILGDEFSIGLMLISLLCPDRSTAL